MPPPATRAASRAARLDRLSVLRDGRVAYRVKHAGRGGTHRVAIPSVVRPQST
ncbi:hypothetical protein A7982_14006 [Minicystis rosea]|nr:hypothetical protein A7982_14006 [Minicystis rosea]